MAKTMKRRTNEDGVTRNVSPKRFCTTDKSILESNFLSKYSSVKMENGGSSPYSPSQSFDEDVPYSPSQLFFDEPKEEKVEEFSISKNCRIPALHRNPTEPELHNRIAEWVSNTTTECVDYNDARPTLFYGCAMTTEPRIVALRSETVIEDPRIRLYSNRFKAKIRLLIEHKYSTCSEKIKSKITAKELEKELDHIIECRGKASYWYRVIKFLNNPSEDIKEMSKLIVISPLLSQVLRLSHRLPVNIPTQPSPEKVIDRRIERGSAYCSSMVTSFYLLDFENDYKFAEKLSNGNDDQAVNGSMMSASIESDDLNSRSDI